MTIIKSNNIYEDIFKPLSLREGTFFYRVLGVKDEESYNNALAYLDYKFKELTNSIIIFTTSIPNPNSEELHLNSDKYKSLFTIDSLEINSRIRNPLNTVISLAVSNKDLTNETIRNNFISKLIFWVNKYVENIIWNYDIAPKCIYYGSIKKHEAYFLMVLSLIGFDVLYFNPKKEDIFSSIDTNNYSDILVYKNISNIVDYNTRVSSGVVIEKVTTYAKQASQELEQTLYKDSGVYKPWQFIKGTTKPVLMNSIIEDTITYWNQEARFRPGFKTMGNVVYTPVFFNKISGVHRNIDEYINMVNDFKKSKYVHYIENTHITNKNYSNYELYSLAFCLSNDKSIDKDILKNNKMFENLKIFRSELGDFIIDKINETFLQKSFFNFELDDKKKLKLLASVLTLDENILNLIDCYDYTSSIPKLIIYLKNRETFEDEDSLIIGFLHRIGLDILILTPNGSNNLESTISTNYLNVIRLEEMVSDLDINKHDKKKTFFQKILGQ